ncbi:unnamed protein product [Phaedon cochleariae]|uniref:Uncharacterized protein n=1 Tax=Phaedon cochleariae TaxID=80249 RepID=A0A9N9WXB4_PHACE|nr:unnamed protein product [Phaedon cochleariae]
MWWGNIKGKKRFYDSDLEQVVTTQPHLPKAKLTPFKSLEKSKKFQEAFSRMGESETLSHKTIEDIEEYVCEIYGKRKLSSVNKARFEIFLDCCKPKSNQSIFGGIKNFEASRIPSCKDTLICKIRRENQIAAIWKFAFNEKPNFFNPEGNGWVKEDGEYKIKWFQSEQFPQNLNEVPVAADDSSEVESEDAHSNDDDE